MTLAFKLSFGESGGVKKEDVSPEEAVERSSKEKCEKFGNKYSRRY